MPAPPAPTTMPTWLGRSTQMVARIHSPPEALLQVDHVDVHGVRHLRRDPREGVFAHDLGDAEVGGLVGVHVVGVQQVAGRAQLEQARQQAGNAVAGERRHGVDLLDAGAPQV